MSNYTDLRQIITNQFAASPKVSYLVLGKPGGGKSRKKRVTGRPGARLGGCYP